MHDGMEMKHHRTAKIHTSSHVQGVVQVYLKARIQPPRLRPKTTEPIRAQFERAQNFPDLCGYGPVEFGECWRTEKVDAGMHARAKAWKPSYPHATVPKSMAFSSVSSNLTFPDEIPDGYRSPAHVAKDRGARPGRPGTRTPGRSPTASPDTLVQYPHARGMTPQRESSTLMSPSGNSEQWTVVQDSSTFNRLVVD